jgi:hypothetical protein
MIPGGYLMDTHWVSWDFFNKFLNLKKKNPYVKEYHIVLPLEEEEEEPLILVLTLKFLLWGEVFQIYKPCRLNFGTLLKIQEFMGPSLKIESNSMYTFQPEDCINIKF